jgi:hypothetical protein
MAQPVGRLSRALGCAVLTVGLIGVGGGEVAVGASHTTSSLAGSSSSASGCTRTSMDALLGSELKARWYACAYGFAIAGGVSKEAGFGVLLAQRNAGRWVVRRGLDDGTCMVAPAGLSCDGGKNMRIAISQRHLLKLVLRADLLYTTFGFYSVTPPVGKHKHALFAQAGNSKHTAVRPGRMAISAGDVSAIRHVHWKHWNKRTATGHGVARLTCAGCASLHATVQLSEPQEICVGMWYFDRIVITYAGRRRTFNQAPWVLQCLPGS